MEMTKQPTIYDEPCMCNTCVGRHQDCWTFQLVCASQMQLRQALHYTPPDHRSRSGINPSVSFYVRHCANFREEEPE